MNYVNKLLTAMGHNTHLHYDKWSEERAFLSHKKKWLANILPHEVLKRSLKHAVESSVSHFECDEILKNFPENIKSPNYGDKWGRLGNYIEINNRAIAEMHGNETKNGIISAMKIIPAIPPSARNWANCVILSQIFPNIYGDGIVKGPFEENSVYGIKLNAGYSGNIINWSIIDKISSQEQFKAFNDLAHFHGLKTGFRTVISSDQIKVAYPDHEENFRWCDPEHQEIFINEHVKLMKLGFECIFIDSAKHIGGYECEHYSGVGDLPEYGQMQYILQQIRERSGMTTLSFVGEKSSGDFDRYKNLGLTAGTAFVNANDYENVKHWAEQVKFNRDYAPGAEVSNDNDNGGSRFEERLNRINNCLFGYEFPSDKLPSFMQMEDLFPLRYDTSTHHLMMTNPSYSIDGTPESHWENLFTKEDGREYNARVGELFAYALNL